MGNTLACQRETLWPQALGALLVGAVLVFAALALGGCGNSAANNAADVNAFGTSYEEAKAAATERAEDAVLLALQCETTAMGEEPVWTYLFASQEMSFMYSVTPATEEELAEGSGPYEAHTYGRLEWAASQWDQVPSIDAVKVGSAEALQKVAEARTEPIEFYSMYLVMHLSGEGSEDTSTAPLVWEVLVNAAELDDEGNVQETPGECYTVDAVTGALSEKVVAEDAEEEVDEGPQKAPRSTDAA